MTFHLTATIRRRMPTVCLMLILGLTWAAQGRAADLYDN